MSGLDAYHATRNLVESSFSHLTWFEDVCSQSGFKGISQIWKEDPAWYFWMNQVDGAFLLRLHAEEPLAENQYVSLTLHYFPTTEDDTYQNLSAGEKWLLSDEDSFDRETNTPRFETYEQFVSLFVVAEVGLVIDPDNQLKLLLYSSEHDQNHPANEFLSLLMTTLNFQSKQHQKRILKMREDGVQTLLVDYSSAVVEQFLKEFNLEDVQFDDVSSDDEFTQWKRAAHMEAVCSMNGACSCHH